MRTVAERSHTQNLTGTIPPGIEPENRDEEEEERKKKEEKEEEEEEKKKKKKKNYTC